jgi:DNA-directed RNA polymerase subunit RPC12/RpoP
MHAYGPAVDVPQLFEQVADPERARDAWHELWSCLCHQGTVYPASFAALPVLAEIAADHRQYNCQQAIALASRIVVGEEQLHEAGYVRAHYPDEISALHRVTQQALTEQPFDGSGYDYLNPLEALLAFEGIAVWSDALLPDLRDVRCPSCSHRVAIDFYLRPPGARPVNARSRVRRLNPKESTATDVHPTAPADLPPLAARLYRLAIEAEQFVAAEHLTYLFGRATCPDCGNEFSVPEQIEAFVP